MPDHKAGKLDEIVFPIPLRKEVEEMCRAGGTRPPSKKGSAVLNMFLLRTLGVYIGLKTWILNRKLAKQGWADAVFKTKIRPGQLEYVSRRHFELGKLHQALEKR